MTRPEGDFVHLIEVDGVTSGAHDAAADEQADSAWPWWSAASRVQRVLSGCAVVGVLIAAWSVVATASAEHPGRSVVHTLPARGIGTDAAGCPSDRTCAVRPSAALAAVRAASFGAVSGYDVYDRASATTVYSRHITAGRGSAQLTITSSCAPHAAPAALDEPPHVGAELTTYLSPAFPLPTNTAAPPRQIGYETDYYSRRDTRGCLVEVWCRYPIDEEPTGAAHVTHRYTATVDRLGMDARVYL